MAKATTPNKVRTPRSHQTSASEGGTEDTPMTPIIAVHAAPEQLLPIRSLV
jgi:hypothetical protein